MSKKTEKDWKGSLSSEQYHICREGGTEKPFSGQLLYNHKTGEYHCSCCGNLLFNSDAKFDSGSGWPSFFTPAMASSIKEKTDTSHAMLRTEIICAVCNAHLGHVFEDGPQPTGLRYCINSIALNFKERKEKDE